MANEKILIVDDDPQIRMILSDRLRANDYRVVQAGDGIQGLEAVKNENPDLILLDLQMPKMDGLDMLRRVSKEFPDLPVIILTAHGSIEQAVEAMKLGARDFLPKPCKPDHILMLVQRALEHKELQEENRYLRDEIEDQYRMIVGKSIEMKKVMDMAQQVARSKTTILIGGKSGTGKQLLARAIYSMSDRNNRPFIQVNCTTLSEQLLESDLFGHEKGAFTGAVKQKKGRFELADRGTIFMDEIGDLSPVIQAKLLHVLEYGEFQRVGGIDTLKADVRIIAASNKNLDKEVKEGRFREDLFYRLNVVTIQLPPLRERPEDIPILTEHFLKKHAKAVQKNITIIAPEAMAILKGYSWPGNIRELENAIERAVVLASGNDLKPEFLPPLTERPSEDAIAIGTPLEEAQMKFKKQFIAKTLRFTNNSQTQAAELLKIQRTYLNRLIKELEITI